MNATHEMKGFNLRPALLALGLAAFGPQAHQALSAPLPPAHGMIGMSLPHVGETRLEVHALLDPSSPANTLGLVD